MLAKEKKRGVFLGLRAEHYRASLRLEGMARPAAATPPALAAARPVQSGTHCGHVPDVFAEHIVQRVVNIATTLWGASSPKKRR